MAPNRLTALRNALAAQKEQKGLTYSELLLDNLIGLDNDYLSAGEQFGQAFNADPLGVMKSAGLSAYEGAKRAVTQPLTTAEELLAGLYESGANVASTLGPEPTYLNDTLMELYGVGYDEATDEQVNRAREALFGDVLNVGAVASGLGAAGRGIGSIAATRADNIAKRRALEEILTKYANRRQQEAPAVNNDDFLPDIPDTVYTGATPQPAAPVDSLERLPSLLERVQRGEPLTEEEAFDVMTFERYGEDGVYDPTNTFENWLQSTGGDTEAAARIAFLIDPTNPRGLAEPVTRQPGPYFEDPFEPAAEADFVDVETIDWDVDDDAWNPRLEMGSSFEVRPTIGQAEGIAGLYSPTRRAVDLLDRPSYDNLDSLRVQLLNRGAKPDELERLVARVPGSGPNNPLSKEDLARFADEASQDVVVSTRTLDNSPRDNAVFLDESYFLKGAEDIGANVFEAPVGSAAPDAASTHFTASAAGRAPVLHTRFGMFRSPGADKPDTYHLGEVQSDWAQTRQKLFPTQETLSEAEGRYAVANDRLMDLVSQRRQMKKDWEQTYGALSSMDPRFPNAPNIYEDPGYQALEKAAEEAGEEVSALGNKISLTQQHGTRGEFDANYPAPYVGTTSKWVQLGLRQSLLDAVNKGAKRMTLSTGEMVKSYTKGKLEGQKKFYDETVIKELDTVLKKFAKEAGIRKPEITMSQIEGSRGQRYTVPTVEFTDEFVEALKRVGLPAYAKGGIVKGSYLDNDPLEPALY